MSVQPTRFTELCALEPGLEELERRVQAVRDRGEASFFCSNHAWLPLASALKALVGVGRPDWSQRDPEDPLYDSRSFEQAYLHLSRQMPPCRACGCLGFQPWRDAQVAQID